MCEVRKRGISAAVICSEPFVTLAKTQAKVFGVPDLALIVIPHPLGGLNMAGVENRAEIANTQLIALIRQMSK
jgi:hypothetical protein